MKFNSIVNRLLPDVRHLRRLDLDPSMTSALYHPYAINPYFRDSNAHLPLLDIKDVKDSFIVKADCPGMSKDQIEIDAQGNTLTIKGHCEKGADDGMITQERYVFDFERMIQLPASIKAAEIKASLKDGVLEIRIPKELPESSKVMIEA